jgi:hypothetical protein
MDKTGIIVAGIVGSIVAVVGVAWNLLVGAAIGAAGAGGTTQQRPSGMLVLPLIAAGVAVFVLASSCRGKESRLAARFALPILAASALGVWMALQVWKNTR